ncbi:MAG: NYN domain-containing protein [Lachnospiraceae bacterium]|nr:NYN domain-containing protein [Lachnospiraceae bacterium]
MPAAGRKNGLAGTAGEQFERKRAEQMGGTVEMQTEKRLNLGILAHVDAGKTTLSEALLYKAGNLRHFGRVDSRDTFLDTDSQERERGITIFSKQAVLQYGDLQVTLLDTPGHVDFSAEAESVLQVLDYCILIVSAADGVKGHTMTIWSLLKEYRVPTMIFVNKMDQPGMEREKTLAEIRRRLDVNCVDLSGASAGLTEAQAEDVAACDEELMEMYLERGAAAVSAEKIAELVAGRRLFPCFFGSALKLEGIEELLWALRAYTVAQVYGTEFAARVFKITRDKQGNRLTHLKIMGGSLKSRELLNDEKVNQIRIYSGERYESVQEATAGQICAVTGPEKSRMGMGYGILEGTNLPILEPVLCYKVTAPEGVDADTLLKNLCILEEEDPQFFVTFEETHREILVRVMGEVQREVLERTVQDRFGIRITFGTGSVVYKETIAAPVEGVGHFEPLRHYAEVHLLLEPLERGNGLQFGTVCSEDILDKNWQRLILTHLREKMHRGVLIGAAVTDMKITILTGRAHQKHTEGGDFRQATYRAVRQGLMCAENILLEPYYHFRMELPVENVGRAMTDVEGMSGRMNPPEVFGETAVLTGQAPVVCIQNYSREMAAYTRGKGTLSLSLAGYGICHNAEEVIAEKGYLPEADLRNPPDSVFCAHGAGFTVPWNEVYDYMHVESAYHPYPEENARKEAQVFRARSMAGSVPEGGSIGTEEVDAILNRTFYSNSDTNVKAAAQKRKGVGEQEERNISVAEESTYQYRPKAPVRSCLVVDGYNMIFAWEELKGLAAENLDSARDKLIDILSGYRGVSGSEVILVFDAYRVKGRKSTEAAHAGLRIVYTGEGETADQYIERFANQNGRKYHVTVATSDRLEQMTVWANNCRRISARELEQKIKEDTRRLLQEYREKRNI